MPRIKKNLLSTSTLAKNGFVVKFVDESYIVHDLKDGDVIGASRSLCHGLYRLDSFDKFVGDAAYSIFDVQAMSDTKLWHVRFGHLNFSSLLRLHKNDMVMLLPNRKYLEKHVCEGCILGEMQRTSFPKDGSIRVVKKLQLVHSDVCGPIRTPYFGNYLYFVTFIDDYSKHAWVYRSLYASNCLWLWLQMYRYVKWAPSVLIKGGRICLGNLMQF